MDRKVILINPNAQEVGSSLAYPSWLGRQAAATPSEIIGDPILVDETVKRYNMDLINPGDIVGIGCSTGNAGAGYNVLKKAKEKGAVVVMGGIHPTILPEEALTMGADAVVRGNGDVIWRQVITDILNRKLRKIYDGGQVPGHLMCRSRWDLVDKHIGMDSYWFFTIQRISGCPENCTFCSVWRTDGRNPRMRLTEDVIAEVRELQENYGADAFIWATDNENPATLGRIERAKVEPHADTMVPFLEQLREDNLKFYNDYHKALPDAPVSFTQATSELASDLEYLQAMRYKCNIRALLMGIEAYDKAGLEDVRKEWNKAEEVIDTVRFIQEEGDIAVHSSVICGLESDTPESIGAKLKYALASGTLTAQFTLLAPFLGTVDYEIYDLDRRVRNGLEIRPGYQQQKKIKFELDKYWLMENQPRLLIEHPNMNSEELLGAIDSIWKEFYSWPNILKRAYRQKWPLHGKIFFALGSKGFISMYGGEGAAADSVKKNEVSSTKKLFLKLATKSYAYYRKRKISKKKLNNN